MADQETDSQAGGRWRRGRRPEPAPTTVGNPGMLRLLWADLRKQPIPTEPDPMDIEAFEAEQEELRAMAAKVGTVRSISAERREDLRRRYWGGS